MAVAEIASSGRRSKNASGASTSRANGSLLLTSRFAALSLGIATAWGLEPSIAYANPTGGVAIVGQAGMVNQGNKLTVTTQNGIGTNYSAINWQSFSIPSGSTTYFQQPSATSTSINRVVTNTPSQLFGTLGSNGNLVLVNQSGIAVGAGAVVDTAGFTASSLRMSDADALAGRLLFGDGLASSAGVSVQGRILARSGDVVLLGSSVDTGKDALIQAPNGSTILAAGRQIELTGRGLEGISLRVQAPSDQAVNLGTLKGDAVGIFAGTLKHSGLIQATTAAMEGGKVVLKASGDAFVEGTGTITATGTKGGSVDVLGNRVALTDQAAIDVSGEQGGGMVRVGGDYQGKNPDVPNAQQSYLGPRASIKADAITNGDGGKVIVWSDKSTQAYGSISARGGANGGDGGFLETSGKQNLDFRAQVDLGASKGHGGKLLLDPDTIYLTGGTGGTGTLSQLLFADNPTGPSWIYQSQFDTLSAGTDVILEAASYIRSTSSFSTMVFPGNLILRTRNGTGDGAGGIDLSMMGGAGTGSGDSFVYQTVGNYTISMTTGYGASSPQAAPIIVPNLLTGGGGISLSSSGAITLRGTVNAGAGNVSLTAAGTVTQLASITAAGLEINASGNVSLAGSNQVGTLASKITAGGSSSFTFNNSGTGGLTIGSVGNTTGITVDGSSGQLVLSASAGDITQTAPITVSSLAASATTGSVVLNHGSNQVSVLAGSAAGASGFGFTNSGTLQVGTVVDGNSTFNGISTSGDKPINLTAGSLNIVDSVKGVNAGAGDVSLTASTGAVSDTFNTLTGLVTANKLTVNASTAISLKSASNAVNSLAASQTYSAGGGGIAFNDSVPLSISSISQAASSGAPISVTATGDITVAGAVTAGSTGTTLAISAGSGKILQSGSGLLTANDITLQGSGDRGAVGSPTTFLNTHSVSGGAAAISIGNTDGGPSAVYLSHTGDATLRLTKTTELATGAGTPVSISVSGNLTAASVNTGTADLTLSAGNLLTIPALTTLKAANVHLVGNQIDIYSTTGNSAAITAASGGVVWLNPSTSSRAVDVVATKSQSPSSLELTSAELDTVNAPTLRVGTSTAGALSIGAAIAPANVSVLSLESGAGMTQPTTGATITVGSMSIKAGGSVDFGAQTNQVSSLAAQVTGASTNSLVFTSGQALKVDTVAGLSGVSAPGMVALSSFGALTQSANALVGGTSVYAQGTSVTLTQANSPGVIAGKATGSTAGDAFSFTSINPIQVTTVNNFAGILTRNNTDNVGVVLNAGSANIGQSAPIVAGSGAPGLRLITTGSVNLNNSSNSVGSLTATGVAGLTFNNSGDLTIGATVNSVVTGVSTAANQPISITAGGLATVSAALTAGAGTGGTVSLTGVGVTNNSVITGPGGVTVNAGTGSLSNNAAGDTITNGGSGAGSIKLIADHMALAGGTINAATGGATLTTLTSVRPITLGGMNDTALSLLGTDLQSISTTGALYIGDTTSNTGGVTVMGNIGNTELAGLGSTGPLYLRSKTGPISVDAALTAPAQVLLNTGGTISEGTGGSISTSGKLTTTASGGTTLSGSNSVMGFAATDTTGAISLTNNSGNTNPLRLGAISASSSVLVNNTGAIAVDGGGSVSAAGSGDAIVLSASTSFTNKLSGGAGALTTVTGGRWLIFAADPSSVTKGGLTSQFRHYGATYANYATATENGNGFIYGSTPGTIYVDTTLLTGTPSNTYGLAPTAQFGTSFRGTFDKEDVSGTAIFTPVISSTTAANSYSVSYSGGLASATSLTGPTTQTTPTTASYTITAGTGQAYAVNPAPLTISANNDTKVYDRIAYSGGKGVSYSGFVNNESATVLAGTLSYSGVSQGAVGFGNYAITPGGLTSGNYSISYVDGTLVINKATISAVSGITAANKVYDSKTSAAINTSNATLTGIVGGDNLTITGGTGTFADKNAGPGKNVTITGLSLGGQDAGNYTLGTSTASTTADISQATISGVSGITAANKVYDSKTSATLNTSNATLTGIFGGDIVTVTGATGAFADKNAGPGKTVTITG
ncbi:MAG: YDG domain-containing protein, partial [Comamonadaceae bacterium]